MSDKTKIVEMDESNQIYLKLKAGDLISLILSLINLKYKKNYTYIDDSENKAKIVFENRDCSYLRWDKWEWITEIGIPMFILISIFIFCVLSLLGFVYTLILMYHLMNGVSKLLFFI
jgi:hypothetical protein